MLEEVVALVINEDEGREVLHLDFPNSLHTELRILDALDRLDVLLCEDSRRATDRAEVEAAVLLASVGDVDGAVALSEHDHATAIILELIHVWVHTSGCGWAHRAARHTRRGLSRTSVVDRMVFEVLRHTLARIEACFDLSVRDVAAHDDGAIEGEASADRIL